ncbi:lactoylglutathione lyase [Frigidibacter albus]|uniref:Lactoylglutathione lyase n=1 Tax=Frigidibacter albus TaxID=1465486 RepID=A0A6L8VI01_9RHOB|nr:VOC family protein [Frigidibacter albus]MZQ89744.1 lactoylglutathione lyase [Frigidibacter albus]NBE31881.1 lactoylglutathione lyase [Frigidibacter albus]GGH56887.1 lactoylglutathione lyase [Frigidibacter albus]
MKASAILETVIYGADPQAVAAFYTRLFGLEPVQSVPGRFAFLRCGGQMLLIFNPDATRDPDHQNGIPAHGATGPGHLCFRAETAEELEGWRARLAELGIGIEHEQVWKSGARSVYLRDPAGNSVEIAEAAIWGL